MFNLYICTQNIQLNIPDTKPMKTATPEVRERRCLQQYWRTGSRSKTAFVWFRNEHQVFEY